MKNFWRPFGGGGVLGLLSGAFRGGCPCWFRGCASCSDFYSALQFLSFLSTKSLLLNLQPAGEHVTAWRRRLWLHPLHASSLSCGTSLRGGCPTGRRPTPPGQGPTSGAVSPPRLRRCGASPRSGEPSARARSSSPASRGRGTGVCRPASLRKRRAVLVVHAPGS